MKLNKLMIAVATIVVLQLHHQPHINQQPVCSNKASEKDSAVLEEPISIELSTPGNFIGFNTLQL